MLREKLMSDDWYRRTTWNSTEEEAFFNRLKRSRSQYNKAQYLRIQAGYLEGKYPEEALKLLDILIEELPEPSELAQAFLQKAHCLIAFSRFDEAIKSFRKVLEQESNYPKALTQGYLDFPTFVVAHDLKEYFQEGKKILLANKSRLLFPNDRYRYHTALAIIEWENGNTDDAKSQALLASQSNSRKEIRVSLSPPSRLSGESRQENTVQAERDQ